MGQQDAFTADDRGRWLVTTRNTVHEFDLDNGTYLRTPVTSTNSSGSRSSSTPPARRRLGHLG